MNRTATDCEPADWLLEHQFPSEATGQPFKKLAAIAQADRSRFAVDDRDVEQAGIALERISGALARDASASTPLTPADQIPAVTPVRSASAIATAS